MSLASPNLKFQYAWIIAVVLGSLASFISNLGVTLQKIQHNHNETERTKNPTTYQQPTYVLQPRWILGLGLIIFGSVADFAALSFGPQSLVAPLGSLTLVSNVVFAPYLLNEVLQYRHIVGTLTIIFGSTIAVVFASHNSIAYTNEELFEYFANTTFIIYACLLFISCMLIMLFVLHMEQLEREKGRDSIEYRVLRSWHQFSYPALSGAIGAQSVLFAKCTVELIVNTLSGRGNFWVHPQSYFVIISMFGTILLQIKFLNDGLQRFDSSYTVPVFTAFWICLSVISGLIFYHEYHGMGWTQLGLFASGVSITIFGVYVLGDAGQELVIPPVEKVGKAEPTIVDPDTYFDENHGLLHRSGTSGPTVIIQTPPIIA